MNRNSLRHNRLRQNNTKEAILPPIDIIHVIEVVLKVILVAVLVSLTTLLFIFIENAVVQSTFLAIKEISVTGTHILSKEEVIEQAEIFPEDNILSINLRHTRLKIISHPWIEDASVKRSLPSKIIIAIKEEEPLAVVHIPEKADIIINRKGVPFTENDAIGSDIFINNVRNNIDIESTGEIETTGETEELSLKESSKIINDKIINDDNKTIYNADKKHLPVTSKNEQDANSNITLPVITGIKLSKLDNGIYGFSGRLYDSAMNLLLIYKDGIIQRISADEESGVEMEVILSSNISDISDTGNINDKSHLNKYKQNQRLSEESGEISNLSISPHISVTHEPVRIKMGFDKYDYKFKIIRHIIKYMQKNNIYKQVGSIDLINPENVVVKVKDITETAQPTTETALQEGIYTLPKTIEGGA